MRNNIVTSLALYMCRLCETSSIFIKREALSPYSDKILSIRLFRVSLVSTITAINAHALVLMMRFCFIEFNFNNEVRFCFKIFIAIIGCLQYQEIFSYN